MTSTIANITFDAADAEALARFWGEVLGWQVSSGASPAEASLVNPDGGTRLYFMRVPEDKQVKNRVHLDLEPEGEATAEYARLTGLGATLIRREQGFSVLADPFGNEFCMAGDIE